MSYNPFAITRSRERANTSNVNDVEAAATQSHVQAPNPSEENVPGVPDTIEAPEVSPDPTPNVTDHVIHEEADTTVVGSSRQSTLGRTKYKNIFTHGQKNDVCSESSSEVFSIEEQRRRALNRKIPIAAQLGAVLFTNWVATVLLPCIAAGFVLNYTHVNAVAIFCINFAAIIPSATALSIALKDLNIRAGEKVSALLNQTFG